MVSVSISNEYVIEIVRGIEKKYALSRPVFKIAMIGGGKARDSLFNDLVDSHEGGRWFHTLLDGKAQSMSLSQLDRYSPEDMRL